MKTDDQLLIDSLKLDLQYTQAECHDLKHENKELREAIQGLGLFLHHLWCDVRMNDYSFQKLNEQLEIVDKVLGIEE